MILLILTGMNMLALIICVIQLLITECKLTKPLTRRKSAPSPYTTSS
jgi:hypothetical protein